MKQQKRTCSLLRMHTLVHVLIDAWDVIVQST